VTKVHRAYRLSETTLAQIEWLSHILGGITATGVVTIAVAELYECKKAEMPLVQLTKKKEGFFDIEARGETLMRFDEEILDHLPAEFRDDLMAGRAHLGDTLVYLVLSLAKGKGQLEYKPDELVEAFGMKIDKRKV
jgi:hypothetical protein